MTDKLIDKAFDLLIFAIMGWANIDEANSKSVVREALDNGGHVTAERLRAIIASRKALEADVLGGIVEENNVSPNPPSGMNP